MHIFAEEILKTVYHQSRDLRKNLKTDWLKIYKMHRNI